MPLHSSTATSEGSDALLEKVELAVYFTKEALREIEFIERSLKTEREVHKISSVRADESGRIEPTLDESLRSMSTGLPSARRPARLTGHHRASDKVYGHPSTPRREHPLLKHPLRASPSRPRKPPELGPDEVVVIGMSAQGSEMKECIFIDSNGKLGSIHGPVNYLWPLGSILLGGDDRSALPMLGPIGFHEEELYALLRPHCESLAASDLRRGSPTRYHLVLGEIIRIHDESVADGGACIDIRVAPSSTEVAKVKTEVSVSELGVMLNRRNTIMLLEWSDDGYRGVHHLLQWIIEPERERSMHGEGVAFDPTSFISSLAEW